MFKTTINTLFPFNIIINTFLLIFILFCYIHSSSFGFCQFHWKYNDQGELESKKFSKICFSDNDQKEQGQAQHLCFKYSGEIVFKHGLVRVALICIIGAHNPWPTDNLPWKNKCNSIFQTIATITFRRHQGQNSWDVQSPWGCPCRCPSWKWSASASSLTHMDTDQLFSFN